MRFEQEGREGREVDCCSFPLFPAFLFIFSVAELRLDSSLRSE
jgi:hypothetical protein